jgi:predicted enzyme related to lactoylglutathione lyase
VGSDAAPAERVIGVGGVFFRASDPEALVSWYAEHLGVPVDEAGYVIFSESRNTVWAPFAEDTDYWPAAKQSMVNFTVRDLDAMLAQLRAAGTEVDERIEVMDGIGRFGWAIDPEGNRFELWEPAPALGAV